MCSLFINDLDAGAGRMGAGTQYTVNNQMVNATLMNIADNPTNVQLPGVYKKEDIPRVPIVCTGTATLYKPMLLTTYIPSFRLSVHSEAQAYSILGHQGMRRHLGKGLGCALLFDTTSF